MKAAGRPPTQRRVTTGVELAADVAALTGSGHRVALVAAHDDGPQLRVVYLLTAPGNRRVELHLRLDPSDPSVPTLAGLSFAAGRFEREMHDLFGIQPVGHPVPRRLVRHLHWPSRWFPMRRDAGAPPPFGATDGPYPFLTVEGPGVYEIPVGPVHAGLIEPGHFRFSVVGETILKLKARLWYLHRGVEKLFEQRAPAAALPLAERISGDTAVGHATAYCRAVEDALDLAVPVPALRIRAVLLELERLYTHVGDLGALCNDVGHGILHAHALRIRERLLRLNAHATGHRLLRGGVFPGGAALRAVPDAADLASVVADARELVAMALGNTLVAERFAGTAVLSGRQAADLGVLGPVARASGLDVDARRDHPCPVLAGCQALAVPVQDRGDVLARFQQRADEIEASMALLAALLPDVTAGTAGDRLPGTPAGGSPGAQAGPLPGGGAGGERRSGVGIVEGWRGTIVHRVELTRGVLTRVKVVDPSFNNWPALPFALANTIVPDFPLANKSFNLSYAGNDL